MIANTPVKDKTCNKTIDLLDLLFEKNLQYTWFRGKQIKDILQHMILQPEQYAFGDIKKSGIIRSTKCQNCGKLLEFKFIPKL